jgi:hypothetical protein
MARRIEAEMGAMGGIGRWAEMGAKVKVVKVKRKVFSR